MNCKASLSQQRSTYAGGSFRARQFLSSWLTGPAAPLLLAGVLAVACAGTASAQGVIPSGTVSGLGNGPYTYNVTFSDDASASDPIGAVWYGWVAPYYNYLPDVPTGASAPAGWTATISDNSIIFAASSPSDYIQPGGTLGGFSYTATFSPDTLAGSIYAPYSAAYNTGTADAFGANTIFTVVQVVPEPSLAALVGVGVFGLAIMRRRRNN
jgi:hypothetical protein